MRRKLPGGAVLGQKTRVGDDLAVACRPQSAVIERTKPRDPPPEVSTKAGLLSGNKEHKTGEGSTQTTAPLKTWLPNLELLLKVLTALVGLIAAILALLGWSRK